MKIKSILIYLSIILISNSCAINNTSTNITRDGKSITQAIKVKSVAEEYEFVKSHCINCRLLNQSLIIEGDKPYDVLNLENDKGEKVSYYFDVSSFFGEF